MGKSPYYKDCDCREWRNLCELEGRESLAEEAGSALGWTSRKEPGEGSEGRDMGCGKAVGVIVCRQVSVRRKQRFTQDMAVSKDNKSRPRGGA